MSARPPQPWRRVIPAPLLTIALFLLWLVLNPVLTISQWLMAALVGLVIPLLVTPLLRGFIHVRHPGVALRLLLHVIIDVTVSNFVVLRAALASDRQQPTGTFVRVPITLREPAGLALLAIITCVTPGTVWTRLKADRSEILIHVLNLQDEAAFIERYLERYERPLILIFQSS